MHAPAFVSPIGCPCPTVVTIHDLSFRLYPRHFDSKWRAYVTWSMPHVLRNAGAIICVSESTRRDLLKYYDLPAGKVHVVHHGVEHNRFHPGAKLDAGWARSIGIEREYLLHVGTLTERKNIPLLLRAIARLRNSGRFDGYQLVLAGREEAGLAGGASITETVRKLDLGGVVVLAGHVAGEQLAGLYAGASLLAMPSLYEGFGFPVLEAMAVGTPVVASDNSSLPEIAGGAASLFVPNDEQALAESLIEVLENRTYAEELRAKGLLRVKQFTWHRAAEQTVAVYRAAAKI